MGEQEPGSASPTVSSAIGTPVDEGSQIYQQSVDDNENSGPLDAMADPVLAEANVAANNSDVALTATTGDWQPPVPQLASDDEGNNSAAKANVPIGHSEMRPAPNTMEGVRAPEEKDSSWTLPPKPTPRHFIKDEASDYAPTDDARNVDVDGVGESGPLRSESRSSTTQSSAVSRQPHPSPRQVRPKRAGDWLRLRPHANRQRSLPSETYAQVSEGYDQHLMNQAGQRGGFNAVQLLFPSPSALPEGAANVRIEDSIHETHTRPGFSTLADDNHNLDLIEEGEYEVPDEYPMAAADVSAKVEEGDDEEGVGLDTEKHDLAAAVEEGAKEAMRAEADEENDGENEADEKGAVVTNAVRPPPSWSVSPLDDSFSGFTPDEPSEYSDQELYGHRQLRELLSQAPHYPAGYTSPAVAQLSHQQTLALHQQWSVYQQGLYQQSASMAQAQATATSPLMAQYGGMMPNANVMGAMPQQGSLHQGQEAAAAIQMKTSMQQSLAPVSEVPDDNDQAYHNEGIGAATVGSNNAQTVRASGGGAAITSMQAAESPSYAIPEGGEETRLVSLEDENEGDSNDDDNEFVHQLPGHLMNSSMGVFHLASPDSKYEQYACRVDTRQEDRSSEIALFSFAQPHMRAFHFSWLGFFVAFMAWFAIAPLLPEIRDTLGLTDAQVWNSNICSLSGTVLFRTIAGPICDKYGARWINGTVLIASGIICMCTGLVDSAIQLNILRTALGIAGSTFVMGQYWCSTMFTREVAGTANSLSAGWGNLGGGVVQILMGSILFPIFKRIYGETDPDDPAENSWRTAFVIPGLMCIVLAIFTIKCSDDCPKGNFRKRERLGLMPSVSAGKSLASAALNGNTWLLIVQYACCFGVEITMTNAAVLYFTSKFEDLSIEKAAAIASIFGWMNLFARGLGGFCSDMMNATRGMRGRLIFQAVSLALQGMCIVVFALADSLGGAITVMIVFSLFVQTSEGAIYAVIPYVKPSVTGSVVGLVGAGGSLGGVMFSLIFRYSASYQKGFITMGVIAAASSLLTPFIQIPGQTSLLCRPCGRFTDLLEQRSLHSVAQASVQSTRSARFGAPTTTVTVAANGRTT